MRIRDISPAIMEQIAIALLGEPNWRLSSASELRYGRKGSLCVSLTNCAFSDFETGEDGGLLDFIVYAQAAQDRSEASQFLETMQFVTSNRSPLRTLKVRGSDDKVRIASAIWEASTSLGGSPARKYLREARAISAPLTSSALRFNARTPYTPLAPSKRALPALVARIHKANGELGGVHLTFITASGSGKAKVSPNRKIVGPARGGFIPLIAGRRRFVVAEGIESAFSAWQVAVDECEEELGCIAAISSSGMTNLEWPVSAKALIIAPDQDDAGERASNALAARAHQSGLKVEFLRPPSPYNDWNDRFTVARSRRETPKQRGKA